MYDMHSCILLTPNFWQQDSGKKHLSCIKHIDFLEIVIGKFILPLAFVQIFIWFLFMKKENVYRIYNVLKYKIYTVFRAKVTNFQQK